MRKLIPKIGKQGWITVFAVMAVLSALLAFAYVPYQDRVSGRPVPLRWNNASVTWRLYPTIGSNVAAGAADEVAGAVSNGFAVWPETRLDGILLNVVSVTRGPNTTRRDPNINDCVNVISFSPSSSVSFSTGTVAFSQIASVTPVPGQSGPPYTYDVCGGLTSDLPSVIFDADMMFNPQILFSTSTPPLDNRFDVQSVAAHEFGHVLGLDHNGIAHTMMFPFGDSGPDQLRQLTVDDVAGVAFLYPADAFWTATGVLSGYVTLHGSGVFASHVVAIDAATGRPILDGLSGPDGRYRLIGLPEGDYHLLALPLAGPYAIENFLGWACGYADDPGTCSGFPDNPLSYSGTFF